MSPHSAVARYLEAVRAVVHAEAEGADRAFLEPLHQDEAAAFEEVEAMRERSDRARQIARARRAASAS